MKPTITAIVFAVMLAASAQSASAGGVFGSGGIVRGWFGNLLDEYLEGPILTPFAKGSAVAIMTVGGTVIGTLMGSPELGAALGAKIGDEINEAAAGS